MKLQKDLPAIELLKNENIFVTDSSDVYMQNARPLRVVALNLMPLKVETETDLVRLLSYSPLQIELVLMKIKSYTPTHTPLSHLEKFYKDFDALRDETFDGMIITGAPVEMMAFEDVAYWTELTQIFDWTRTNVCSTLFICWAAQAGLYHYYGVPKYPLSKKKFGIFAQQPSNLRLPIFRGFDDEFFMPHSRHTEIRRDDILKHSNLAIIASSTESGVSIIMERNKPNFFITGHLEYAPNTLDKEYKRDRGKRDDVEMPEHYYQDDDPEKPPLVIWRAHATLLFNNWLNFYVNPFAPHSTLL